MAEEFTQLLLAWGHGDESALERLTPIIYDELHRLAHYFMRGERAGQTLQTTALINEDFVRLLKFEDVKSNDRKQFFALAATVMRRVLIDLARERQSKWIGGNPQRSPLHNGIAAKGESLIELIAIDEALEKLLVKHWRQGKVFEMTYFGGYEGKDIAEFLGVSPATVTSDWKFAKNWFARELELKAGVKDEK